MAEASADDNGEQMHAANAPILLRSTAIFRDLSDDQLAEIRSRVKTHTLLRSEVLVRQGAPSNSIYVVISGRFEVWIEGQTSAINEIGVGEPIGEIGFFAGIPRTATIVAARDSVVIELDRDILRRRRASGAVDLSHPAAHAWSQARRGQCAHRERAA